MEPSGYYQNIKHVEKQMSPKEVDILHLPVSYEANTELLDLSVTFYYAM